MPKHETTIRVVQMMHKIVVDGGPSLRNKILVHCHAGQGRTAIIIGAYLLYAGVTDNVDKAVSLCREGRSKLFKNKYNIVYLQQFGTFLKEVNQLFPTEGEELKSILKKQRVVLQGTDSNEHKHLPKLLSECLRRLRVLLGSQPDI